MKLLITGACGFVASHFAEYCIQLGHEVVTIDRIDAAGSMSRLPPGVRFIRHDLASPISEHLDRQIGDVTHVVHMAAASHVDRSVTSPRTFVDDNFIASLNMLEWARTRNLEKFYYMSTDEVFGAAPPGRVFAEHDVFSPTNPYAATKAAAECLCPAWAATYHMPIVLSHATNLYGFGQAEEKYIPTARRKVLNNETLQIHSNADCTVPSSRYYLHISDACRAFMAILQKGTILGGNDGGRYNLSGGEEHSNLLVAETIAALLGRPLKYELVSFVPNRPRHDMVYRVGWERLKELGWEPLVPLELGLKEALGLLPPPFSELGEG